MKRRKPEDADRSAVPASTAAPGEAPEISPARRAASEVLLGVSDRILTLVALALIAPAGVFLTIAWIYGPQVWVNAAQYRHFTQRTDARIVESWLALDVDLDQIRSPPRWRASAKASPCAVVEFSGESGAPNRGEWGAPIRRAFCGPLLGFNESYTLADVREIAPHVPFAWAQDGRGFAVPELRLAAGAEHWLATHPADRFMHAKWPAATALDWLKLELDMPVDFAIAGWSSPPPQMTVAYDPRQPGAALPAGTVDERVAAQFSWPAVLVGGTGGLLLWFKGMSIFPWLRNFTPIGRYVVAALPLLGLPWFAGVFPQVIRSFSVPVAEIIGDMFGDLDPLGRLEATEPGAAAHAGDPRIVWRGADGVYAGTFGRLRYTPPRDPFESADAALAALVNAVTVQVSAMDETGRVELFAHLKQDKEADLKKAGIVFLPAAKIALVDPGGSVPVRRAAKEYLSAWFTMPTETFDKYSLGYQERLRLEAQVADVR